MANLEQLDQQNIWHPFSQLQGGEAAILIDSAKGPYLFTRDGRTIIDAVSSWWVNLHGHSNEFIAQAIYEQAKTLEHVIFAGFTHAPAIKLSENLLTILPTNQKKIFFSDDGSTAVEVALKIAIQYWHNLGLPKRKIIAIEGAYHGDTFGSMAVADRSLFTQPFEKFLFDVTFIPFPGETDAGQSLNQFKNLINEGNVAAFIFEPLLQGAAGMRMYNAQILDSMIGYAQSQNVICIADEVLTGFGRTGKMFASAHLNKNPDIIAMSKGITGGTLPLGVTSCAENVIEAFVTPDFFKTFFHGHSYTANPIACAAANASFQLLASSECQSAIERISNKHKAFVEEMKQQQCVAHARSLGTVCAIELKTDEGSSYENQLRKKIYSYFISKNILLRPLGNVIYILPPYVISDSDLDRIYDAIRDFCTLELKAQ